MIDKTLVVISYYDRRPIHNLVELVSTLRKYSAGEEYDICIVVNRTKDEKLSVRELSSIPTHYRHNLGMNIGAWDYGWRVEPGYKNYLFLQDECYVIRDNWLKAYRAALECSDVGMIGESLNLLWNRSWPDLRALFKNVILPEHLVNGRAVNRVDFYLDYLKTNGVNPGETGTHLRSVVWFFSADVLKSIDGFLIGRNYGECIAAEIATSKKVEALGLKFVQANDKEEFFYIRHLEYNQDSPGCPYAHETKYVDYASIRRLLESKDKKLWPLLKLKARRLLKRTG